MRELDDPPSSVKIGWRTYSIEVLSRRESAACDLWGEARHWEAKIILSQASGSRLMASTLLHEILHCIFKQWQLPEAGEPEERIVHPIQHGLSQVWRDNWRLMDWIGRNLVNGGD